MTQPILLHRHRDIDSAARTLARGLRAPTGPHEREGRSWFVDLAAVAHERQWAAHASQHPALRSGHRAPAFIVGRTEIDAREAQTRLDAAARAAHQRDITSADPGAAALMPIGMPTSVAARFATTTRARAVVTAALHQEPLPDTGMTVTAAQITTGPTTAVQATQNATVSETDTDTNAVSSNVVTIAGLIDVSVQSLERSDGTLDAAISAELGNALAEDLEDQVLNGTGVSGQLLGLRAVVGQASVAYTDASPTSAELLAKLMDARQRVATALGRIPTHLAMHPRRASWLAAGLSTAAPMFTTGSPLDSAPLGGMVVLETTAITTNRGAGTNEDEIYVISAPDLTLLAGPVRIEAYPEIGSANGTVRFRAFMYAALLAHQRPEALATISGTGLVTPTF